MAFDLEKWKSDPKHETERNTFKQMVQHTMGEIVEEEKKKNPPKPEEENLFDWLARCISGGSSDKK